MLMHNGRLAAAVAAAAGEVVEPFDPVQDVFTVRT